MCQKYVKKGYMEMGKWIYLQPLKSAPCRSILHYLGDLHLVKDLMQQNDYMFKIDLKDAFHFTEVPGGSYIFNEKVASANSYFLVFG